MSGKTILLAALLYAAPIFCQQSPWSDPRSVDGQFEWIHLLASESEIRLQLGQPSMIGDFDGYRSWQYRIGEELDHDDFSHALVFRRSDGKLVSLSRTYTEPRLADAWFPHDQTVVHTLHASGQLDFQMRVRRLPAGTLLLAPGSGEWGKPVQQLVLIHESVLARFYPELAEQMQRPDRVTQSESLR
ncbi:MAG: hypothetical protein ABI759_30900 [Candidatus Solibacter sp.]